jgi:arylsulfatase
MVYFTENELSPGAVRVNNIKFVFNLRGDDGQATGGLSVDSNLGWKGPEKYVAVTPQLFDLWQDPQERYDILMNSFTENTWLAAIMGAEVKKLMTSYVKYPPRKSQSLSYNGPITISNYEKFGWLREQLAKDGFQITLPSGN